MARTTDEAFEQLLSRLPPTGTESGNAAAHRVSIEQCLKANFGMTNFFRSGSFGYGTSVSGYSDVDYFAVIPAARLHQNSEASLAAIASALRQRFPLTNIRVESPAVVVPFGSARSEQHEIIPAYFHNTTSHFNVYGIPDRAGGWMLSSPDFYGAYVDGVHKKLGQKGKPLIRLVKAWKYFCSVPIRSFYLEMRVTEYADTQNTIMYRYDVLAALNHLVSVSLGNLPDPLNPTSPIYAAFQHEIQPARTKLDAALASARAAQEADQNGRPMQAFSHWDKVFNGNFPAYY